MFIDPGADNSTGSGHLLVDPDKLIQLKRGIEDEAARVRDWLFANRDPLRQVESPGTDPCSIDTMDVMSQVGGTAIDKAEAYITRLTMVADKLHESAAAYGTTEDHNAAAFRQEPR